MHTKSFVTRKFACRGDDGGDCTVVEWTEALPTMHGTAPLPGQKSYTLEDGTGVNWSPDGNTFTTLSGLKLRVVRVDEI